MPFITTKVKPDHRIAIATGVIVAVASYFNLFALPASFITKNGCLKGGGQLQDSRCTINNVTLDVRG